MSIIIGRDYDGVEKCSQETKEHNKKAKAEQTAAEWAAKEAKKPILIPHHEDLATYQPPHGWLKLDHLSGEHVVKCEKLDPFCVFRAAKTLHIHHHPAALLTAQWLHLTLG